MMPECDLDDNDPLSEYLKRAPMIGAKNAVNVPVSSCICCLGVPLHDEKVLDSMKILRKNINQNEPDKVEATERKNDREAIRRRLAMNEEDDYLAAAQQRPIRKPNLQSRLQNGMNLQICFMNEAASDSESSDSETCPKLSQGMSKRKSVQRPSNLMSHRTTALNNNSNPYSSRPLSVPKSVMDRNEKAIRPMTLTLSDANDNNFFTHQARLQIEARMALAQAKDMAHMQMEFERQKQPMCPITELVHKTLEKVGMKVPLTKRRLSRQMLTNMNIAQLQIIINEFHSFIETLNEMLVKYLMDRDEISMRQDSMLIDIEDITRYLAEKEEAHLNNNNRIQQQQQRQHLDPKKAPAQRTTAIRPANNTYNNNSNKKSLVVNGNGHSSVITSISRENFEQQQRNRLHL
ncbi:hypothetical protein PVAND_004681 [Polypedilum vanderplanki]|uniref:Schwannomin interacting protein 1 C-terminal domain-containing protein n=1 Tax=Polypedilum vanderplanki TaxID=319348 RepID=A0A9J6BXP2_POLVA|nr:hypothetical protein PVAND_004681 [Polypedilum vanderplanki]